MQFQVQIFARAGGKLEAEATLFKIQEAKSKASASKMRLLLRHTSGDMENLKDLHIFHTHMISKFVLQGVAQSILDFNFMNIPSKVIGTLHCKVDSLRPAQGFRLVYKTLLQSAPNDFC